MAMGMAVSRLALARLGLSAAATATALTIGLASARAAEWADALALEPPHWEFDNYEIRLGGTAAGALFTSSASGGPAVPSGYDTTGGSAIATGNIRVQKTLDTGMVLGARGDFLL